MHRYLNCVIDQALITELQTITLSESVDIQRMYNASIKNPGLTPDVLGRVFQSTWLQVGGEFV